MLKVNNVTFSYDGNNQLFENLSFQIAPGEIIWLKGENGSGKSTLLKILAQLLEFKGDVIYSDKQNEWKNKQLLQHLSYIPDKPYLFEYLTGEENALFLQEMFCVTREDFNKQFYYHIEKFNLTEELTKPVQEYSLGMRHKLFWSAMFSRETTIYLLDEPFTAFDQDSQTFSKKLLKEKAIQGKIIIFVSHLEEVSQALATKIFNLQSGKIYSTANITEQKFVEK